MFKALVTSHVASHAAIALLPGHAALQTRISLVACMSAEYGNARCFHYKIAATTVVATASS